MSIATGSQLLYIKISLLVVLSADKIGAEKPENIIIAIINVRIREFFICFILIALQLFSISNFIISSSYHF